MRKHLAATMLATLILGTAALTPLPAQNTTPDYIPLQGQLTEQNVGGGSNIVAEDGVYTISVRVYESPTGSAAVWQDTFENLPVVNGVFNVILGSQRSLDDLGPGTSDDVLDRLAQRGVLYVGLVITHKDGTAVPQPVEMLPRLTLLPVALASRSKESLNSRLLDNQHWSFYFTGNKAKDADKLDGIDSSSIFVDSGDTETPKARLAAVADEAGSVSSDSVETQDLQDGAVTPKKLAARYIQKSPPLVSDMNVASMTWTSVQDLDIEFTVTGDRPILIIVSETNGNYPGPDSSNGGVGVRTTPSDSTPSATGLVELRRVQENTGEEVFLARKQIRMTTSSTNVLELMIPATSLIWLDDYPKDEGSYTYKVYLSTGDFDTDWITFQQGLKLVAVEL